MDRWQIDAEVTKPTPAGSPQFPRVESQHDPVIEAVENNPIKSDEPHKPGFLGPPAGDASRRLEGKEKLWNETCNPGDSALVGMQAAAGGFVLGVVSTLLGIYVLMQIY